MTFDEFQNAMKDDQELRRKFEAALKEDTPQTAQELAQTASRIAAELGCDVPASEFMLKSITDQELNEAELDRVAGGGNGMCDGAPDCDELFLDCNGTSFSRDKRCYFLEACDEEYGSTQCSTNYYYYPF